MDDYYYLMMFLAFFIPLFVGGFIVLIVFIIKSASNSSDNPTSTPKMLDLHRTKNIKGTSLPCDKGLDRKTIRSSEHTIKFLWRILAEIANFYSAQEPIIKERIQNLKKQNARSIINKMSVDKINRNGTRINVGVLKYNRIKTIGDLMRYEGRYEQMAGIGKRSSENIKMNLNEIVEEVNRSVKIKLSYDDRNKESDMLVHVISIYNDSEQYSNKAKDLLSFRTQVNSLLKRAKKLIGSPFFIFKQKETINEIKDIENELNEIYNNNFSNINDELINPFNNVKETTINDAWHKFKKDPIPFNKVIERFVGAGNISQGLLDYSLSSDVALAVKETPLDLNGFKLGLRPYQEWGSKYIICQRKTIIGDEMGLGKTVEAIAAMVSLKNHGAKHFMVICPLSVLTNWCREIYRFSDLRYYKIYQYDKQSTFRQWIKDGGVAITTYETLDSLPIYEQYSIDLLIVDEAHLIKNSLTLRTRNTKQVIEHAVRVTFLTGTVLENKVDEMIKLIGILNKEVAAQAEDRKALSEYETFKEAISKVYFRRRRVDVLSELPEKTEIEDWCDLNEVEITEYETAVYNKRFMDARRVSWNVDASQSTKMDKLKSLVEMAKNDDRKVLVFSFFLETISLIKKAFGQDAYGPIYGGVSAIERQNIIDRFNDAPAGSVLVCQIQSGGIGLNIQSASVVVICEPQFKPSIENQAISRSYRMGQARNVLVYHLLATNTVDERLNEMLAAKQMLFNNYADTSLIADKSFQIDKNMFTGIMQKEYERIASKHIQHTEAKKIQQPIVKKIIEDKKPIIRKDLDLSSINFIPSPNGGVSVTRRVGMIKQPRNGYLNISEFETKHFDDRFNLGKENINPSLIGTAVDYLSRYVNGTPKEEAFRISLLGAANLDELEHAKQLLKLVNGLTDTSIISAIKLVGFDVAFRNSPLYYKPVTEIWPDKDTIRNVRIMVGRSNAFFKKYGPVIKDGFTFEGGYTKTISTGDGDFLTEDTLWDFKVIKNEPTSKHTLQILVYYLMGIHSKHPEFKNIKYIGIFNPRLNVVYKYDLSNLPPSIIENVEQMVIGYK